MGQVWDHPLSSWGQRSKNKPPQTDFAPLGDNMAQEPDRYLLYQFSRRAPPPRFGPLTTTAAGGGACNVGNIIIGYLVLSVLVKNEISYGNVTTLHAPPPPPPAAAAAAAAAT